MGSSSRVSVSLLKFGRGYCGGAELLMRGLKWEVCNARGVAFWRDIWMEDRPLSEMVQSPIQAEDMDAKVVHYWDRVSGWRWGAFAHCLSLTILVKMDSIGIKSEAEDKD